MSGPDPLALPGLPKDAGGAVFAEPWQAHAFALVVQLHAQGAFSWAEWAQALSEALKSSGPADDGSRYYEQWLAALERLATAKGMARPEALAARKAAWDAAYRRTPHGQPVILDPVER